MAIRINVFDETVMAPIDTAALSIWADHAWHIINGGKTISRGGAATAVDGKGIDVVGTGRLDFEFWGLKYTEEVASCLSCRTSS